jgi:hypothetical protein
MFGSSGSIFIEKGRPAEGEASKGEISEYSTYYQSPNSEVVNKMADIGQQ